MYLITSAENNRGPVKRNSVSYPGNQVGSALICIFLKL